MHPDSRQDDGQVTVRVHPPERRRRTGNVAACGCCCCCCCCLHSIGGLIGSAAARRSKTPEDRRTTATYWICLLVLLAVPFLIALGSNELTAGLLIIAMALPAGQLAASLIAGVIARISVGPSALHRIWSITWRGFMGAVIGLGIMLIPLFAANDSPKGMFLVILGLLVVSGFLYSIRRRPQRA